MNNVTTRVSLHNGSDPIHVRLQIFDRTRTPRGYTYSVPYDFCLEPKEAERLLADLFSCVDTLKGIKRSRPWWRFWHK